MGEVELDGTLVSITDALSEERAEGRDVCGVWCVGCRALNLRFFARVAPRAEEDRVGQS